MEITVKTTLAELIRMIWDKEKEEKTPTAKKLRLESDVIAESENCIVYCNGYAVYENATGRTVMWLKDCTSFTYRFDGGGTADAPDIRKDISIGEEYLTKLPWVIAVTLVGDHRIESNSMNRSGSRKGTQDYGSNDKGDKNDSAEKAAEEEWQRKYNWKYERFGENPETAVIRKEEQEAMLERMTEKQKEVFVLYYREGYRQEEIGEMLNISRQSVNERLMSAIRRIKK